MRNKPAPRRRYLSYLAVTVFLGASIQHKLLLDFVVNSQRKDIGTPASISLLPDLILPCNNTIIVNGAALDDDIENHEVSHEAPFHFAACLLSMDDNKILPEWLAYHYEVLPLRRLIFARDPYSVTSSIPILDAYQHHLGMNISIWNDEDYNYAGNKSWEIVVSHANATSEERGKAYIWRQQVFYTECAKQLKEEGHTWVAFIDTDEYISFNFFKDPPSNYTKNEQGVPCEKVNIHGVYCREDGVPINMMKHFGLQFPSSMGASNATIAQFIGSHWNDRVTKARAISHVCDVLPRVSVGVGKNSSSSSSVAVAARQRFDELDFRTLRYRHLLQRDKALPGKVIMNVQNWVPTKRLLHMHVGNKRCFNAKKRNHPDGSLSFFRIHHYTGTFEEFMSRPRDQYRRSAASYNERNEYNVSGNIQEVVGWLESFVQRVGHRRAYFLTQGLRKWAFATDAMGSRGCPK